MNPPDPMDLWTYVGQLDRISARSLCYPDLTTVGAFILAIGRDTKVPLHAKQDMEILTMERDDMHDRHGSESLACRSTHHFSTTGESYAWGNFAWCATNDQSPQNAVLRRWWRASVRNYWCAHCVLTVESLSVDAWYSGRRCR